MEIFETLKQLSETPGPSGNEHKIAQTITDLWQPYADEIEVDRIGSVIAVKHGQGVEPRPQLLLAAHLDEIGLMVKDISDHQGCGFMRLTNVGGVDIRHLYGQTAVAHGKRDLVGVLGSLPGRMLPPERSNKPYGFKDLVLDVGMPADELRELVDIGDFVSFRQPLRKLQGSLVTGKALDNRASVMAVTACFDYLNGRSHAWDLIVVATAQEETRLLGAYTTAFAKKPDAAVAIDVTFGKGAMLNETNTFNLGGGPVLGIGPNVHPGMHKALKKSADKLEMKTQPETHTRGSGTDAFGLQVAREGIPTGLVSIPLRYMHTMVETIDTQDVERVGRLLAEFLCSLDTEFLENLSASMMEK
ncbi:MAG: M28 family peptidase [Anaerolineales bacterium]|nr:M28 family peptidase [Anaerolineales bacterium]